MREFVVTKAPSSQVRNPKIQMRVLVFLKRWLQGYPDDFHYDERLTMEIRSFLKIISWDDPARIMYCKPLLSMLWGFRDEHKTPTFSYDMCDYTKFNTVDIDVMVMPPTEVAAKLTEQDRAEFSSLTMIDLLNLGESTTFRAFVARANKVSMWVVVSIIECQQVKLRVSIIKQFIKVAQELHKLKNYNGLSCIVTGLYYPNITGLHTAWEELDKRYSDMLEKFSQLLFSQKYRGPITRSKTPLNGKNTIIPSISTFVRNMMEHTILCDANKTQEKNIELVNFVEMKKIYELISDIRSYQIKL